jgi:hypothetical protein
MAAKKPLTIDQFDAIIDTLTFGRIGKFSRYDAATKQRLESDNGRKVDLRTPDEKPVNLQPVGMDAPLAAPFGASLFVDDRGAEKWNMTLTPVEGSRVFQVLRRFDERVLAEGKAHPEWFREAGWKGKQLSEANIEANFGSTLKEPEPDKATGEIKYHDHQWKVTLIPSRLAVFVRDDAEDKYKYHERDGHLHISKTKCEVVPVVSPAYVWFTGNQWGVKWFLNKVVVPRVHTRASQADLSDMLGMEGLKVETAREEATGKRAAEGAAEPDAKRPCLSGASSAAQPMAPPSPEDVESLFLQC